MTDQEEIRTRLAAGTGALLDGPVLALSGFSIRVRSNSAELIARLTDYFSAVIDDVPPDIDVIALERPALEAGDLAFADWKREEGKTGRKDAILDLDGGRLVRKVRTGMVFLQSGAARLAAGPCLANDNQVINFINAQYMNHLQQKGALILHASGLVHNGQALGIAGFSGGGKSTLMLHMLGGQDMDYLTNDRLFIQSGEEGLIALGIPKLPRINPGTIINNDNLRTMLPDHRVNELRALPPRDLWELEEKHDVDLRNTYGKRTIASHAPLARFLILNWQRDAQDPCAIERVDLATRQDLLPAIMKSPGPFYQDERGGFLAQDEKGSADLYVDRLQSVEVFEARGRVDFAFAAARMVQIMDGET